MSIYEGLDDVYVEYYPETVYFMCPQHIISYVYGSGVRYVTFEVTGIDATNELEVKIIHPQSIVQSNIGKGTSNDDQVKRAFVRRIDPQHLFKYLANFDMNYQDYEQTLNPVRYRHVLIQSILKQYIRENMFIGELEVEMTSPVKKQAGI